VKSEKHSSLFLRWRELAARAPTTADYLSTIPLRWRELVARDPTTTEYLSTFC